MAHSAHFDPLEKTQRICFILFIIVNVDSDIVAVASLKTDSIDMEIIKRFQEKKRQKKVSDDKHLNKMMWSQALCNGTENKWGIRSLSLVSQIIV